MKNESSHALVQRSRALSPRVIFLVGGALVLLMVLIFNQHFLPVLPFAAANLVLFALFVRRLAPIGASPVIFFSGYLSIIGLAGFTLTNVLVGSGGTGGVDVALTNDLLVSGAILFFYSSSVVLIAGALLRGRPPRSTEGGGDGSGVLDLGDLSRFSGAILILALVEFMILIAFLGVSEFISRPDRLVGRDSSFEAVFQMIALAAVVAIGIVVFSRRGVMRGFAVLLLAGYVAYFISLGTRRLALLPILILLGYILARRGRVPVIGTLVASVLALLMLALPLYFRGLPSHGLVPHLEGLVTFALSPEIIATSANNILAGFKISALTAFTQAPIQIEALWISINPVTGDSAGWYEIARSLRLNQFTPYSAIGELGNYGAVVLTLVMGGIGLLLGLSQRINDVLLREPTLKLVGIAALGLTFVFVIQSAQYNLRSNMRYLYLMLAIQVIALIAVRLRQWSRERNGL